VNPEPTGRPAVARLATVLVIGAMAFLASAIALCSICAARIAAPVLRDSAGIEARVREENGFWHWLVFKRFDTGIAAFDRYEADLIVNEFSSLNADRIGSLQFIVDGRAYMAPYAAPAETAGARGRNALVYRFRLTLACLRSIASPGSISVRTVDRRGSFREYSVSEPGLLREAARSIME